MHKELCMGTYINDVKLTFFSALLLTAFYKLVKLSYLVLIFDIDIEQHLLWIFPMYLVN
jgi:hypothetical protein